ncbi:MAG: hypothetical protein FWE15_24430 [Actinomycetia bacterium]|nr:hypothetical protein [Actinomycetes bacterium]MCL2733150.1 hypothetical protein [Actinomycetes bacterium]
MLDIGPMKLLALLVLTALVFGDRLPEMIARAARFVRMVRSFTEDTKQEIRRELGPEFSDFEFEDLHPRKLVAKHLLGEGDPLGLREIQEGLGLDEEAEAVRDAARTLGEGVDLVKRAPGPSAQDGPAPAAYDPDAT